MNPLLISGFGTTINVDKRNLIIENKIKKEKLEFLPHQTDHDSIIIDGHTGCITFESLRWLTKHDISLTLLNWNGNLLTTTLSEPPKSGQLRIKQYQSYLNSKTRHEIASKITHSKIKNTLALVHELGRFYEMDVKSIENTVKKEIDFLSKTNSKSINSLMTFEGRVASVYFEQLTKICNFLQPQFKFKVRKGKENSRNYNASDEINALLNYGYAILESEVRKAINSVGLDYSIGFLHEIAQSRTPLVYDIQELFRWLIDLSVIQLLEEKPRLLKSDFIVTENYYIRLREKTAKRLIEKIRSNFNTRVSYKKKNYSYQIILLDMVQILANHIAGKSINLEFNVPEMKIQRNDTIELQDKILEMTPKQRKESGINKSTLWYMKKNIQSGKTVKIYDKILGKINYSN